MLRKRMLIGLGGCFLASGAAWADGVAYVDCASHPETTLVFGKPRRTPETVAAINCGERFTILQYGFIFSRVQTKDGQVGYVYSNLISADRSWRRRATGGHTSERCACRRTDSNNLGRVLQRGSRGTTASHFDSASSGGSARSRSDCSKDGRQCGN